MKDAKEVKEGILEDKEKKKKDEKKEDTCDEDDWDKEFVSCFTFLSQRKIIVTWLTRVSLT